MSPVVDPAITSVQIYHKLAFGRNGDTGMGVEQHPEKSGAGAWPAGNEKERYRSVFPHKNSFFTGDK